MGLLRLAGTEGVIWKHTKKILYTNRYIFIYIYSNYAITCTWLVFHERFERRHTSPLRASTLNLFGWGDDGLHRIQFLHYRTTPYLYNPSFRSAFRIQLLPITHTSLSESLAPYIAVWHGWSSYLLQNWDKIGRTRIQKLLMDRIENHHSLLDLL